MTERIVIISDTQIPYDDHRALAAVIQFIGDWQPDRVIHIGDVMDFPQPSRWNKGTAGEFEGSVFKDCEAAKRRLLDPLRTVFLGPIGFHEGNHDERARTYLSKYAPALAQSGAFNLDVLLDFASYEVDMLPPFYDVAPGWLTTHGHVGKMSLSQNAGSTAVNGAKKFGKSVACGHTHRLAIVPHSFGYAQTVTKTVYGMEVGHLMNMRQADYLKGGAGNWQMGFGILTADKTHVKPEVVPISKGRFVVDGSTWEV